MNVKDIAAKLNINYTKRSNTIGALNRGHESDMVFMGGNNIIICPPQPKFDPNKPPPYRLGIFTTAKRPKVIFSTTRYVLYWGTETSRFLRLNDLIYTSWTYRKLGPAVRYKR